MRLTVQLGEIFVYRALESLRASGEKGAWVECVQGEAAGTGFGTFVRLRWSHVPNTRLRDAANVNLP